MTKNLLEELINIINPRERVTDIKLRTLSGRLKDYSEEEIISAAIAFSKSEWHKKNNEMRVDNLIRPSKFDRWFAIAEEAKEQPTPETQDEMVRKRMR